MSQIAIIFKRELAAYFSTPIAYVFLVIFIFLSGIFAFDLGDFFARGQADLAAFFSFHPWLYLFLVPAIYCILDDFNVLGKVAVKPAEPASAH